jgi:chromate transporter
MENNFNEMRYRDLPPDEKRERLKEIFKVFIKLGVTAFGGPAAHTAMMDEEVVKKRKWLSREKFMDLIGATNLIPGPNSTELAIHLGFDRGGLAGLFIAGISFILPAMLIVLFFAWMYVSYGSLPELTGALYGIKAVIMAIILQALYRLGKSVIKGWLAAVFAIVVVGLSLYGVKEIPLLLMAGVAMLVIRNSGLLKGKLFSLWYMPLAGITAAIPKPLGNMEVSGIFLTFLKIGSVLYGSGYVLIAFLRSEFVDNFGVITSQQLLDAVAVGQFTPGPVFTTATFVGYLIQGIPGAIAGTIGIFLPSFLLVWLLNPVIPKLRSSKVFSAILDGVNIASMGLMASVTLKLGMESIVDPLTIALFAASFAVLMKTKLNSAWLIVAGGLVGYAAQLL